MRSRAKWASAASIGKVRDDWAVLRGRAGIAPPRPAALQGRSFDPARGTAGVPAEMSVVPRCLADGRDGCRFLGSRRGVGARDARGVVGCSRCARLAPIIRRRALGDCHTGIGRDFTLNPNNSPTDYTVTSW